MTRTDCAVAQPRSGDTGRRALARGGVAGVDDGDGLLMAQRSASAIRALYQFMNALIDRLIDRYTAMMMAMPSIA